MVLMVVYGGLGMVFVFVQEVKMVFLVDLKCYVGKWYEIVKIFNSFQKKCIFGISVEYFVCDDGMIDVVNCCKMVDGMDEVKGVVWVVLGSNNSKLEVCFVLVWLFWILMVWGDYWIMDLDD